MPFGTLIIESVRQASFFFSSFLMKHISDNSHLVSAISLRWKPVFDDVYFLCLELFHFLPTNPCSFIIDHESDGQFESCSSSLRALLSMSGLRSHLFVFELSDSSTTSPHRRVSSDGIRGYVSSIQSSTHSPGDSESILSEVFGHA